MEETGYFWTSLIDFLAMDRWVGSTILFRWIPLVRGYLGCLRLPNPACRCYTLFCSVSFWWCLPRHGYLVQPELSHSPNWSRHIEVRLVQVNSADRCDQRLHDHLCPASNLCRGNCQTTYLSCDNSLMGSMGAPLRHYDIRRAHVSHSRDKELLAWAAFTTLADCRGHQCNGVSAVHHRSREQHLASIRHTCVHVDWT